MYEELSKIPPEIIADYRRTGQSQALNDNLKEYVDKLEKAIEAFRRGRSIRRAAKILNGDLKHVAPNTCRNLINDAINFFNLNSSVKEEAWCNYYAEYFDELSKKAEKAKEFKEARLSARLAAEYRIRASEVSIDPELLHPKDQLISPDVSPERLGLEEFNLKKLWVDTETFIEELPIDSGNKERIKKEAKLNLGITDAEEYEEPNN